MFSAKEEHTIPILEPVENSNKQVIVNNEVDDDIVGSKSSDNGENEDRDIRRLLTEEEVEAGAFEKWLNFRKSK